MKISLGVILLSFATVGLAGLAQAEEALEPAVTKAAAVLSPTQGNQVKGRVEFAAVPEGVLVTADVEGLSSGKHGFHIHEVGSCDSPDGSSAGPHYNPHGKSHAGPTDEMRHAGDLGNVTADESGRAHLEYVDSQIQLNGEFSIVGRSVIVHEKEDDFKTQPTGNAGSRVACGVIVAEPS